MAWGFRVTGETGIKFDVLWLAADLPNVSFIGYNLIDPYLCHRFCKLMCLSDRRHRLYCFLCALWGVLFPVCVIGGTLVSITKRSGL
jgi:hypothetical protein